MPVTSRTKFRTKLVILPPAGIVAAGKEAAAKTLCRQLNDVGQNPGIEPAVSATGGKGLVRHENMVPFAAQSTRMPRPLQGQRPRKPEGAGIPEYRDAGIPAGGRNTGNPGYRDSAGCAGIPGIRDPGFPKTKRAAPIGAARLCGGRFRPPQGEGRGRKAASPALASR